MWKCVYILVSVGLCVGLVESTIFANDTELGTIQGLVADDGDYVMFLGIPYAQVNASNPFGASIPHPKYDKVFKAFNGSIVCPQIDEFSNVYAGSLDCLRLNVYVPNSDSQNKSVVIYIHGGSFRQGNGGKYVLGPQYLVRHDVIVVTFNYRLGPYGFLCTESPEIPGNQGIKDQYMAMKWVKNNIRAFGGSPDRITLMGHSAGSMCVDMHMLAKQPRLYQQAILQSGVATTPDQLMYPEDAPTLSIARNLGVNTSDISVAIFLLANTDPKLVINVSMSNEYKFCIENQHKDVFGYITEHPEKSNASNVDGLNILSGVTNNEFLFALYGSAGVGKFNNPNIFRQNLNSVFHLQNVDEVANIIQRFYLDGQNDFVNRYKVADYLSDCTFYYPIQRALNKYKQHKNTTIFFYVFSYDGNRNYFKSMYNVTESGAAHADELGYLFHGEIIKTIPTPQDVIMADKITMLWTNFMKHGNPTPYTNGLIPVTWPPIDGSSNGSLLCLRIDKNLEVISWPFHSRMAFWELLYKSYGSRLNTGLSTKSSANIITFNSYMYAVLSAVLSNIHHVLCFLYR